MARQIDRRLFKQIFSDAHVVDIDLSRWDKQISLCVVADHVKGTKSRAPLFLVSFLRANRFSLFFKHHDVELHDPGRHFQWNVDECQIQQTNKNLIIMLYGGHITPCFEIECAAVEIRRVPNLLLDELFPGWNAPYSGFARPGIEEFGKLFQKEEKPARKQRVGKGGQGDTGEGSEGGTVVNP
jgi:hypothetical protein